MSEGTRILGGPIGTDEFKRSFLLALSAEMKIPYKALKRIPKRLAFLLLAYVYTVRPLFVLRMLPPDITWEFCVGMDSMADKVIEDIAGVRLRDGGGHCSRTLRGLPVGMGGLGLPYLAGPAAGKAYLCCQAQVRAFIRSNYPEVEVLPLNLSWVERDTLLGDGGVHCPSWLEGRVVVSEDDLGVLARGSYTEVKKLAKELVTAYHTSKSRGFFELLCERRPDEEHEGSNISSKGAWYTSRCQAPAGLWMRCLVGLEAGNSFFPSEAFGHMLRTALLEDMPKLGTEQLRVCGACDASLIARFTHDTCCRKSGIFST